MKTYPKKYYYICTYPLQTDSALRKLYIKDTSLDDKEPIQIFDGCNSDGINYKLSIKIGEEGRIEQFVYKTDYDEINKRNDFEEKALDNIIKSLQCIYFSFIGLQNQDRYSVLSRASHPSWGSNNNLIEIWNYETGKIESPIEMEIRADDISEITFSLSKMFVYLEDIKKVLTARNSIDKIDQYIELFLILENLSSDPVLHLITLFSLYEYINKTSENRLKELFTNKGLEKKFRNTRNFAAHGKVEGKELKEVLENFLGVSPIGFYSFDRYNPSHINLINEVIGEAQPIIQKYLRGELGLNH